MLLSYCSQSGLRLGNNSYLMANNVRSKIMLRRLIYDSSEFELNNSNVNGNTINSDTHGGGLYIKWKYRKY